MVDDLALIKFNLFLMDLVRPLHYLVALLIQTDGTIRSLFSDQRAVTEQLPDDCHDHARDRAC